MNRHRIPPTVELTGLADGTLNSPALLKRVVDSPILQVELERQSCAVAALRGVELASPAGLRTRVEAERSRARGPRRRRRVAFGGALAAGLAAAGLLVALFLPQTGPAGPTVVQAAQLAHLPAAERGAAPGSPKLLGVTAFGLAYPDWGPGFGWEAAGVRRDQLEGREAVTVFYGKGDRQIGYTILGGPPVGPPDGTPSARRGDTTLHHLRDGSWAVATWERDGHTCVLSGKGVPVEVLLDLAGWRSPLA
jgi:hypothetical protein